MHSGPRKSNLSNLSQYDLESNSLIISFQSQGTGILQTSPQFVVCMVDQLKFLYGQPLNNLAWNWLHTLRASNIAMTTDPDEKQLPTVIWGVTIFYDVIDGKSIIRRIQQAVMAGAAGLKGEVVGGLDLMKLTNEAIKKSNS